MGKIRNRKLFIAAALICISFFLTLIAFALVACGVEKKPSDDADYYLSLASKQWQTYNAAENIPDDVHFKSSGNNLYTLEITLDEGEQFTVNQTGSDDKIGFGNLFSSGDDLVRGDNDSMKVNHAGTFVLSYYADDDTITYDYTAYAVSVRITTTDTNLFIGGTYPFKAVVVYSNDEEVEESVVWTSSNTEVLSVDKDGNVSALAQGTATLTATAHGISSAALSITVKLSSIPVTGLTLDESELTMDLGEERKLQATVQPEDADDQRVIWQSDNESAVTVSQDGMVKAVGYGAAIVKATTAQYGFQAECTVTVVKHVEEMRFVSDKVTVVAGGKTKSLELVFSPSDANDKEVEFTVTSGTEYAEVIVENGGYAIRGLAEGEATITATLKENHEITASCSVTVLPEGTELASMPEDITAMINEPTEITVSLQSAQITSVAWSIADSKVATISGEGVTATITGVDFGSTVVTATVTAENGETYTAKTNVLVSDEWYFIYGYNLGASGYWDSEDYLNDREAAKRDGLLFTEQSKGIYSLTRQLTPDTGFQIIFPKVGNYTQYDDTTNENVWSKNIPSHWVSSSVYYSAAKSTPQYVKNATEYFCVNAAGVYTITLDLTGTSAQVGITMVSLDVTQVNLELSSGKYDLNAGEEATVSFTVLPANAEYSEEDVTCSLTSAYADYAKYISCKLNFADHTVKLTAGEAPENFTATLHLSVKGIERTLDVYVFSPASQKTEVTDIHFVQSKYEFNVNNGAGNWTTTVKALVNADATNQQVRYYDVTDYNELLSHPTDERATVDPITGEITARSLGTLKIKAVSLDDPNVYATVDVLFYSDQIYIVGDKYGGWTARPQNETKVVGAHANYVFTKVSNTQYTYHFSSVWTGTTAGKFKIVFLGMDDLWTGEINSSNVAREFCNTVWGWDHSCDVATQVKNIYFQINAAYDLTLDLSMHMPVLLIDCTGREKNDPDYALDFSGNTILKKDDKVTARLQTYPVQSLSADQVEVTYQGNDGNISHTYDGTDNTITFTVLKQELKEDRKVDVSITVGNTTSELSFTVVAQHHLEFTWDNDNHWYYCTDEGCDYIEDDEGNAGQKSEHDKQSSWSSNAEGHYYACSKCGAEFGLVPHEYDCSDGVFDFSDGMKKCKVCEHDLFEISGNTLVYYYGREETVKVPDNVTVLGAHVFEGHTELKTITYSNNLTTIGDYCFAGCTNLKSVRIGNYVTSIGEYAFKETTVQPTWGLNLRLTMLDAFSFAGWLGTSFKIPEQIKIISSYSFKDAINLKKIVIPDTVKNDAFTEVFIGCTSLTFVDLASPTVTQVSGFEGCTALETVIIRSQKFWEFYADSFKDCDALKAVYLARPLDQILTCGWLFMKGDAPSGVSNRWLKGKVYVYSDTNLGPDPCGEVYSNNFGFFRDWIAGTWHWDSSGKQNLDNIVLWEDEVATTTTSMPAILNDDKRGYLQA